MAPRKAKYQLGDIFLIDLNDNGKGAGRVIKKSNDTVFVELYRIKPIKLQDEFVHESVASNGTVLRRWVYDDSLKNGDWPIIHHDPVEDNYKMPDFWTDSADGKYYLIPGSDTSGGDTDNMREITEKETEFAEMYGIASPKSIAKQYLRKLSESKLV